MSQSLERPMIHRVGWVNSRFWPWSVLLVNVKVIFTAICEAPSLARANNSRATADAGRRLVKQGKNHTNPRDGPPRLLNWPILRGVLPASANRLAFPQARTALPDSSTIQLPEEAFSWQPHSRPCPLTSHTPTRFPALT